MKNLKFAVVLIICFMTKQLVFSQTKLNMNMNTKKNSDIFIPMCKSTSITQQTFKKDLNKFVGVLIKTYYMKFESDSSEMSENENYLELYKIEGIANCFLLLTKNSTETDFSIIRDDSLKSACIKNISNIKYEVKGYQVYNGRVEILLYYSFDNLKYYYFSLIFNEKGSTVLLDFDEVGVIE